MHLAALCSFAPPRLLETRPWLTSPSGGGRGVKLTPFAVAGIPGAQAFKAVGARMTGYSIQFADGPFWYLVAYGFPTGSGTGSKADVIAAAHALFARVHGKPPG